MKSVVSPGSRARGAAWLLATALPFGAACATPQGAGTPDAAKVGAAPAPAATTAASAADKPPAGLGARDNATTLGPYGAGPLTLRAHRSADYSGSVNSWLIESDAEVALVDAQLVMPEAERVVELIRSTGKSLAWVWVTHGHPDHYAGLEAIAKAFPGVPLYGRPATVEGGPALLEKFQGPLQRFFPGEMTSGAVALTPHGAPTLSLGGVDIEIVDLEGGEHPTTTMLKIPALRAALIGDLVYHDVHPWLNELDDAGVLRHIDMLATLADVDMFFPGHGVPFDKGYLPTYRTYVTDFLAEVPLASSADDLVTRMWRRYPAWRTLAGLRFSASAYMGARKAKP